MYIAISGNIGSGKTSLVEILSKDLGWETYYENINNPYLDDFYQDMSRWSFNLQICFLGKKIEQIKRILASEKSIIQDRTIFEEAYIFASNLYQMGLMTARDYNTYIDLFNHVIDQITQPDLIIYLKAGVPTLVKHIQKRGRSFEMGIEEGYLERLNLLYENWIEGYDKSPILTIDVDQTDFVTNPDICGVVVDNIRKEIERIKAL